MKIVVFGANGPVGRLLTKLALADGNQVTAVTRHPEAFPQKHDRLRIECGDVLKADDVERAVRAHEAVLSVVGVPFTFKRVTVYSEGMRHILPAMTAAGILRLVCVTSGGTNPRRDAGEGFVFGRVIKPIFGRTLYADMRRMEDLVMASDRDWTIVRPARLVDTSGVIPYRVQEGYMVPGMSETKRADLAEFLLREAVSPQYVRKAVAVATPR